jgi:hypothetical protein
LIARDLMALGFTETEVDSLTRADAFRLSSWINLEHRRAFLQMGIAAGVLYGLQLGLLAYSSRSAGLGVVAGVAGFGMFLVFAIGGTLGSDLLQGALDRYYWFGRAGADLVRAVRRTDGSALFLKELAIRAARTWHRQGVRRGIDIEIPAARVFALLGDGPLAADRQVEVAELVRESLLDAIQGKVDPLKYEMHSWFDVTHSAFAGHRAAVVTQILGVIAAAVGLLAPVLGLLSNP